MVQVLTPKRLRLSYLPKGMHLADVWTWIWMQVYLAWVLSLLPTLLLTTFSQNSFPNLDGGGHAAHISSTPGDFDLDTQLTTSIHVRTL